MGGKPGGMGGAECHVDQPREAVAEQGSAPVNYGQDQGMMVGVGQEGHQIAGGNFQDGARKIEA